MRLWGCGVWVCGVLARGALVCVVLVCGRLGFGVWCVVVWPLLRVSHAKGNTSNEIYNSTPCN